MKDDCPCKDCNNRSIYCHSECDIYVMWNEEHKKEREKLINHKNNEFMFVGVKERAIKRFKRGKRT